MGKALLAQGMAGTETLRPAAWGADLPGPSGHRGRGHEGKELVPGALKANKEIVGGSLSYGAALDGF